MVEFVVDVDIYECQSLPRINSLSSYQQNKSPIINHIMEMENTGTATSCNHGENNSS